MDQTLLLKKLNEMESKFQNLEAYLGNLETALNNEFSSNNNRLAGLVQVVTAQTNIIGMEKVEAEVKILNDKLIADQIETEKRSIQKLLDEGRIQASETTTIDSMVIGNHTDADGKPVAGGRVRVNMNEIDEDTKALILGHPVGYTVTLPNNNKFEIQEIYVQVVLPEIE